MAGKIGKVAGLAAGILLALSCAWQTLAFPNFLRGPVWVFSFDRRANRFILEPLASSP